ncbi:ArsR/SmtB family transcription factor [Candidatus Riflebacteria bacterium]
MAEIISIAKALAEPNRARVLSILQTGELCACQLIEFLNLAPSTVSKHLSILKQAGLVQFRKEGRWIYYRLPDGSESQAVKGAITWLCLNLKQTSCAEKDRQKIQEILKIAPEDLCRKYANKDC